MRRSAHAVTPGSVATQSATIRVRPNGELRLAVVADTHSQPHPNSLRLIEAERPDAIIHGGDIGDLKVLEDLGKIAKVFAVRGNIDERNNDLPDVMELDIARDSEGSAQTLLKILLLHIAVNGPKLRADAFRSAQQRAARLVICGHSHVPFIGNDRGISVFNPGSIGPRRFMLPIVFGMFELKAGKLSLWHVDCESGKRWLPP